MPEGDAGCCPSARKNNFQMKMKKEFSEFNIVISGVGGQGLITLLKVLAEAALETGYEVRSSELHGLSQRGGSVEVHLRFGKKIYSPLVKARGADLIISLEAQEALLMAGYAARKTVFLVNNFFQLIPGKPLLNAEAISGILQKISSNVFFVSASEICREKLGNEVVAGIYLLGGAVSRGLLPLGFEAIISSLKKTVAPEYLELNLKAFNLAK